MIVSKFKYNLTYFNRFKSNHGGRKKQYYCKLFIEKFPCELFYYGDHRYWDPLKRRFRMIFPNNDRIL